MTEEDEDEDETSGAGSTQMSYLHALIQVHAHARIHAHLHTRAGSTQQMHPHALMYVGVHVCIGSTRQMHPHALVQAIFFEAHAAERRVICESQLMEAAIGLIAPATLEKIRSELPRYEGRADKGHYVEILTGEHIGERGVVTGRPFRVKLSSGVHTHA